MYLNIPSLLANIQRLLMQPTTQSVSFECIAIHCAGAAESLFLTSGEQTPTADRQSLKALRFYTSQT